MSRDTKPRFEFSRSHLWLGVVLVVGVGIATILSSWVFETYVLMKAEQNITNLLLTHRGVHHYVQKILIPQYSEYQHVGKIADAFYAPELLSSSYMVRNLHDLYNKERALAGFPEMYYKMAAKNPRNPVNKADEFEACLIEKFNADRSLKHYNEIRELDGKKFLYVAIPFLSNQQQCMKCHGNPENAPKDLQTLYPERGGFNEKIGDIRAITSIRAPLENEYKDLFIIGLSSFVGFISIGILIIFNSRLHRLVKSKTLFLEKEIDERKLIEENLKIKNSAIAASINAIALFGNDRRVFYVNGSFLNLWGAENEREVLGRDFGSFWTSKDDADKMLKTTASTGQWVGELSALKIDGQSFLAQISSGVIKSEDDKSLCLMISVLDITDKRKYEEMVRQSQKLESIGTLAGGIAHDFNNMLVPILGYAEMVNAKLPQDSDMQKNQQEIINAAIRARELVQQILSFARKSEQKNSPIKVSKIINEVAKFLRSTIPTTIQMELNLDEDPGVVIADQTQIYQVFLNLCTNAYQAMAATGGRLLIKSSVTDVSELDSKLAFRFLKPGKFLKITVRDTGPGMSRETLEHLFEPYYTTKKDQKGSGLGLAVAHGIIKGYGGHIAVYSEPGQGSEFCIYLPYILDLDEEKQTRDDTDSMPDGHGKILVVDDEEMVLKLQESLLKQLGYEVVALNDSLEAWKLLKEQSDTFDLLLTDMTMPNLTGYDLAKNYLSIRPAAKIILCTGYSDMINHQIVSEAGIYKLILKPVGLKDLARVVHSAIESAKK